MARGYILGAGSQGRVLAETWRAAEPSRTLLFLDDDPARQGTRVLDIPIAGPTADFARATDRDCAVIALGDNEKRLATAARFTGRWAVVVHPSAVVMPSATIGEGTVVFAGAIVNTGATLGCHVLVNTRAVVEHDCVLEDGASVGPGVSMGGRVTIARGAFVGTGAVIAPRIRVGAGTIVGAGAVVVKDLPARVLAICVPARAICSTDGFDWNRLL